MPGASTLDQPIQGRLESLINYDDQFSEQEKNLEGLDSQALEELRLQRFETVKAFLRKPKVSLEYVRALPVPVEHVPEPSRTAGSFDLNAVKNKIEKATSSVCHTWD